MIDETFAGFSKKLLEVILIDSSNNFQDSFGRYRVKELDFAIALVFALLIQIPLFMYKVAKIRANF